MMERGSRGAQPAQQKWVTELSIMMQSVLFAAVRAPDGLRKDHPIKVIMRWYRRSVLISAFDGRALDDPFAEGGGSFTGPFTVEHAMDFTGSGWDEFHKEPWKAFGRMRDVYLRHVDEMPHHFQLHMMHAAQIVGAYHPIPYNRAWWRTFYLMIVNDAHLEPEPDDMLARRLSDNELAWRDREITPAK